MPGKSHSSIEGWIVFIPVIIAFVYAVSAMSLFGWR